MIKTKRKIFSTSASNRPKSTPRLPVWDADTGLSVWGPSRPGQLWAARGPSLETVPREVQTLARVYMERDQKRRWERKQACGGVMHTIKSPRERGASLAFRLPLLRWVTVSWREGFPHCLQMQRNFDSLFVWLISHGSFGVIKRGKRSSRWCRQ